MEKSIVRSTQYRMVCYKTLFKVFNQLPTLPISASNYGKVHENKAQNGGGFLQ